jgi:glycosyltransferase involved in cell wall biosynthesis
VPDPYIPHNIATYLAKRASRAPWSIATPPFRSFSGAVVIPSLAEATNLPQTLESLSHNPVDLLECYILLVVVNQRTDASAAEKADNRQTLLQLPVWKEKYHLRHLFWVDAASGGLELPHKQGVGLARKIGLDLALLHLDYTAGDPHLICLDADTLVQPDYLASIRTHFASASAGGVSIPYQHRPASDTAGQDAIDRYELFLRIYVLGLQQAGSPYAFHTVGSAMACRASAYVASGGMNRRQAGEDFYFLQQVYKTSGVATLVGTIVHPSPRASNRVPFGTGRAVGDMLADGAEHLLFYQPVVFSIVGEWLACVQENTEKDGMELLQRAGCISPVLREFLVQTGFPAAWDNLRHQNIKVTKLICAFHSWFDSFRTMRLIHELSDKLYPRITPEKSAALLLERTGNDVPDTVAGQLNLVRRLQGL